MSVFNSVVGRVPAWSEEEDDEEFYREFDSDEPEEFLGLFGRKKPRRVHAVKGRQNVTVATPTGISQVKLGTAMVSRAEINPELKALQDQVDSLSAKFGNMADMQQQQRMMSLFIPMIQKKMFDSITFDTAPVANQPANVVETKQTFDLMTLLLLSGGFGGGGSSSSNSHSSSRSGSPAGMDMMTMVLLLKAMDPNK